MKVEAVSITAIKPYENNPRKNTAAVNKVAASIASFGFKQPIVVDKDHVIIVGHTRWLAAQSLGLQTVPVIVADNLEPAKVKAYRLADNKTAEYSKWDEDRLKIEMRELMQLLEDDKSLTLSYSGFEDDELARLLNDHPAGDSESDLDYSSKLQVVIDCEDEADQEAVYKLMTSKGYKCRILSM